MWLTFSTCLFICFTCALGGKDYYVLIFGERNVVVGGTLQLRAEIYDSAGYHASGDFQFSWKDNAIPEHSYEDKTSSPFSVWNVTFTNPPGPYNIEVDVSRESWFMWPVVASIRFEVNVSLQLNGQLSVEQNNVTRKQYVSTNTTALHNISLSPADEAFIHTRNQVRTFWFLDCQYIGMSDGLSHNWNYSLPELTHYVEALVVASYVPPTPAPTTTTSTTTTTTSTTTTSTTTPTPTTTSTTTPTPTTTSTTTPTPTTTSSTTTTTTTTPRPTINPNITTTTAAATATNVTVKPTVADAWSEWMGRFVAYNATDPPAVSGFCINMSSVPMVPNTTYGYFNKKLVAKTPVRQASINGSGWLKEGEVLNMTLSCNGSGPFSYCLRLVSGLYNVTNREKCDEPIPTADCNIHIGHLFRDPNQYTVVVIVTNLVSKLVQPIGVNVYKVTKQPQLSVIVVPVTFSLLAVILIIFGIAYYFHNRNRYTVEVADFDFGQQTMEYKSFRERLRESIAESFYRINEPNDAESTSWSPSRKYGSMQ